MLRISLTMKREIQNASYRLFINNESTSLTMSVSTYRLIVSELRSISRNVPLVPHEQGMTVNVSFRNHLFMAIKIHQLWHDADKETNWKGAMQAAVLLKRAHSRSRPIHLLILKKKSAHRHLPTILWRLHKKGHPGLFRRPTDKLA